jgi:hypothetical protein
MIDKSECYAVADQLRELTDKYERLIIEEPGSNHPDCYVGINLNGEEFYLQRERNRIVLVDRPLEQTSVPISDLGLAKRIEAAKYLPDLLTTARCYNEYYLEEAEQVLQLLKDNLPKE